MGFLFRAAAVVGLVYWLSPLSDSAGPSLELQARDAVARQASRAAEAALALCAADKAGCLARAAEAATTTTGATRRPQEVPPVPPRRAAEREPPPEKPRLSR